MTKKLPHQKPPTIIRFFKSFGYAGKGILMALEERNMKFHAFATVLVIAFGLFFSISNLEWAFIIILMGLVLFAEMLNTALEGVADLLRDELKLPYLATGRVRDIAAGAVLILAITAATLGMFIFYPYFYNWLI